MPVGEHANIGDTIFILAAASYLRMLISKIRYKNQEEGTEASVFIKASGLIKASALQQGQNEPTC